MSLFLPFALTAMLACQGNAPAPMGEAPPPAADLHATWNTLLKAHVKEDLVDYQGFVRDKVQLDAYCALLTRMPPGDSWTKNEKLAYYINLYNAQTVKLIADNYPVKSIKDLSPTLNVPLMNTVWHATKFNVGSKELSLDEVEHGILRKMDEPRIHFAVNCASISCPPLRNEAFTAAKLEQQLADQAERFINTAKYNRITPTNAKLSAIFNWFEGDFKVNGTLIDYLNRYCKVRIEPTAKVSHLEYDWNLNDAK